MEAQLATTELDEPFWVINRFGKRHWTDSGRKAIVNAYLLGTPTKEIGEAFGCSKNVVVGQIHRAREKGELPKFQPTPTLGPRKRKRKTLIEVPKTDPMALKIKAMITARAKLLATPAPVQPPKPKVRLRVVESPTAVTLEGLESHMCRWPLGDPRYSDFRFCGGSRIDDKHPYCAEHTKLGTQISRHR